jgi:hypothetical protein
MMCTRGSTGFAALHPWLHSATPSGARGAPAEPVTVGFLYKRARLQPEVFGKYLRVGFANGALVAGLMSPGLLTRSYGRFSVLVAGLTGPGFPTRSYGRFSALVLELTGAGLLTRSYGVVCRVGGRWRFR